MPFPSLLQEAALALLLFPPASLVLDVPLEHFLLVSLLFSRPPLGLLLLVLQALQGLKEGLATLLVENLTDGDEFPSVVPLVVSEKHVQCVQLEDLDAGVEVAGCVGPGNGFCRTAPAVLGRF